MSTWILIITLYNGGLTQVPFNTQQECVKAGDAWKNSALSNMSVGNSMYFHTFCMEVKK